MIQNILVAYDGSPSAKKAFLFALDLTAKYNAKMTVLSVVHYPESTSDLDVETVLEMEKAKIGQLFQSLKDRAAIAQIDPEFVVKVGKPTEQIVCYTLDNKIDHIVMGHENHRMLTELIVGSVAKYVIDNASCGVTVIS